MKTKCIVLILAFYMTQNVILGQSNNQMLETMPQEVTFVHLNAATLFTGERLFYTIYALERTSQKPTSNSKIGYVSLQDDAGTVVFTHKLRLDSGIGFGDFFLPTSLSTGVYKLLGYTEWMKNFGSETFFEEDVYIVNPYKAIPERYLESPTDSLLREPLTKTRPMDAAAVTSAKTPFDVVIDKKVAGKRERMVVSITGETLASIAGNYSLSVKKKDAVSLATVITAQEYLEKQDKFKEVNPVSSMLYLPEIRGEVLSGTILEKDSKKAAENKRIALSLPGSAYWFKIATSDEHGRFHFILDRAYENKEAVLQVLSSAIEQYTLTMDDKLNYYEGLTFPNFSIPEHLKEAILQRSIHNQIENAYAAVRADSLAESEQIVPFYRDLPIQYDLDAYTRFNTLQETIIEVTDHLSIKTLDDGSRVFEIRPNEGLPKDNVFAAVFVDGLFLENHEAVLGFSARTFKSISFSRDDVFIGSQQFEGVLSFKTAEGDFFNEFYAPDLMKIKLFAPESQKEYFIQNYDKGDLKSRIPDFRQQLIWLPNLELNKQTNEIIFYTSDVTGLYELVLEGVSSNGNPVSVKREFVVK